jgi:hypothetical protein
MRNRTVMEASDWPHLSMRFKDPSLPELPPPFVNPPSLVDNINGVRNWTEGTIAGLASDLFDFPAPRQTVLAAPVVPARRRRQI